MCHVFFRLADSKFPYHGFQEFIYDMLWSGFVCVCVCVCVCVRASMLVFMWVFPAWGLLNSFDL